jgi:hypothetical protein
MLVLLPIIRPPTSNIGKTKTSATPFNILNELIFGKPLPATPRKKNMLTIWTRNSQQLLEEISQRIS